LIALRTSTNDWFASVARRLLAERRDPSVIPRLRSYLHADRDEPVALRDLWALHVSGGLDDSSAIGLLEHPVAGVRRWTVRLLGDDHRMNSSLRASLVELARNDPDPLVRSQIAASCQRWEATDALAILDPLMRRTEDRTDTQIPLLIWWAIEKHLRTDRAGVVARLANPEVERVPIVREVLLERVARVLAAEASPESFAACGRLLDAAPGDQEIGPLIEGMEAGLAGRHLDHVPDALDRPMARLWSRPNQSLSLIKIGVRFHREPSLALARHRLADPKAPEADRMSLAEVLGQVESSENLASLLALLDEDGRASIQSGAINALGGYNQPEIAARLLAIYPKRSASVRDRILTLLCSRPGWAGQLLDALEKREVAPKDLRTQHVVQVVQLHDPELVRRVERIWGRVPGPGSPEKIRRIAEVRGILVEGDKGKADRGRPVFKENCAVCHRLFDEGEQIGPELTGSERGNLDFLLTSMVDPSASIRKEYQAQSVALKDGRVLSGLVAEESASTITLVDSNRQRTVVPRDQIEEMKPSDVSLMPEGVLDKLREDQVRDLFKYLQSNR
jgi:putative heme-binding domain-containing protein